MFNGSIAVAQNAISYENVEFSISSKPDGLTMIYELGTDEADAAWEDLFQWGSRTGIDASEAAKLQTKVDHIRNQPDHYVITLDVVHQLHCLGRRISLSACIHC